MKSFYLGIFFTFTVATISFPQLLDNINTTDSIEKKEISLALLHFEKAINTGDLLELPDGIRTNVLTERENSKISKEFENIQINCREITIGKDSATVTGTYFFCYDSVRSEEQNYTIHLIKKLKWEIRSAEEITKNLAHIKIQNKPKTGYTLSLNTMLFSETTMQQIPWSSSLLGTFWRINYLDAINYLGEAILSADCEIDGDIYYDSNNKRVGFFLDPCSREIVYSLEGKNETSIYRDLDVLENPVSISVNQWGEIFVVDAAKHCIMKLLYDENTRKIVPANATTPFVDIKFEDRNPLDIDYYYNQTQSKADDIIAVTYPLNNRIAFYRSDGSLITRIHNYSVAGLGSIEFDSPCKVLLFKSGTLKIAIIQKDKKQLLIGRLDLTAGTITCTNDPVNSENPIYQLGRDISNNILATSYFIDISLNRIAGVVHKFDEYGKYTCSFTSGVTIL
ncbi:MAG: hypothetical protein HYV28_18470 [Ignavibacteriales bacterium]|nr:hypothetical protein [Ignavibacteriales bacterium]